MDKEFVKSEIMTLRGVISHLHEVYEMDILNDELINSIDGPLGELAYDLLKQLYDMNKIDNSEKETEVFNNYMDFLSGQNAEKYNSVDTFIDWINREVI